MADHGRSRPAPAVGAGSGHPAWKCRPGAACRHCCVAWAPARSRRRTAGRSGTGWASVTVATIAEAVIGPTPGMVASRRLASLSLCQARIAASTSVTRCPAPQLRSQPPKACRASVGRSSCPRPAAPPPGPPRARSLWRDNAQLRHMAAQGVHQHGPLPHQQVARPVQHQHRLLLGGLDRHEPHRRPRHRLADRLGIGRIGLATLDVGLHVAAGISRTSWPNALISRAQ